MPFCVSCTVRTWEFRLYYWFQYIPFLGRFSWFCLKQGQIELHAGLDVWIYHQLHFIIVLFIIINLFCFVFLFCFVLNCKLLYVISYTYLDVIIILFSMVCSVFFFFCFVLFCFNCKLLYIISYTYLDFIILFSMVSVFVFCLFVFFLLLFLFFLFLQIVVSCFLF